MHNHKVRGYVRCYVTSIFGWSVNVGYSLIAIKLGTDPQHFTMNSTFSAQKAELAQDSLLVIFEIVGMKYEANLYSGKDKKYIFLENIVFTLNIQTNMSEQTAEHYENMPVQIYRKFHLQKL